MTNKSTDELMESLTGSSSITEFLETENNALISGNIAEYLNELIQSKGMSKYQVFKHSEINEVYGYQILKGSRIPSRDKLIALSFGIELSLSETQQLLKFAGYAPLYPKSRRDSIIIFGLTNQQDICLVNENLYKQREDTL